MIAFSRLWTLCVAAALSAALVSSGLADANPPTPDPAPTDTSSDRKGDTEKPKAIDARSLAGYRVAYDLIYQRQDFIAAIAQLRALGRDDDADVANLIGFASRKLGRYDDAKRWYDRALAADPRHVRTWQYYGMWHAEQGNLIKASEFLDRIEALCGGAACAEYTGLKGAIEGSVTY